MITKNYNRDTKIYTLRLDNKIFNGISQKAKEHRRSTAKEIEFAVEQYLKNQK